MSVATKAGIIFAEGENVLVELEASLSDRGKGLRGHIVSAETTIVITNRRILAISGAKAKKKCNCNCSGAQTRSIRYFIPSQITETGYELSASKSCCCCCCKNNNFKIYIKTSNADSIEIALNNMEEKAVQAVIDVIYGVIRENC